MPAIRPLSAWVAIVSLSGLALALADEPAPPAAADVPRSETAPAEEIPRVSLDQARERALLMHEIYTATLDAMHTRYFHGDKAVVPARAMEDVFREMEQRTHTQAKWISASFKAMSLNHDPQTEFERLAAKQLSKGEAAVETIESGYYRRAGSIPLNGGCISCHSGLFASTSPARKFAGLVISVPVTADARLPEAADRPSDRP